jgi:hypothetical protein
MGEHDRAEIAKENPRQILMMTTFDVMIKFTIHTAIVTDNNLAGVRKSIIMIW